MAIQTQPQFTDLEELYLDPQNPRLGRKYAGTKISQEQILELMEDWKLDELGVSFLENGTFWINEALLVVEEKVDGKLRKVVVEGNRRLAALNYLKSAFGGKATSRKWRDMVEGASYPDNLFKKIPYLLVDQRKDVEAFLGFRHVTGIEEWDPADKAAYISRMIDESGMTYQEVMRKIGSKTPAVRQHYIAHQLLLEIDKSTDIPDSNFESRFSVMYLSLRTSGVEQYLELNMRADPDEVKSSIPKIDGNKLKHFAEWIFGNEDKDPVFKDSRKVDLFGHILKHPKSISYLEESENPSFEIAVQLSGGDELEVEGFLKAASENVQLALTRAHRFKDSQPVIEAAKDLALDTKQLLMIFPDAKAIINSSD
jgi:hypothetical protein